MVRCCFFVEPVETQVLFYGAPRDVASNGTVVVYVHRGNPNYLDVICFITSLWLRPPRLTTPLVNDGDLWVNSFQFKVLSGLATFC